MCGLVIFDSKGSSTLILFRAAQPINALISLLGHELLKHQDTSVLLPTQSAPPFSGAGLSHNLVLVIFS